MSAEYEKLVLHKSAGVTGILVASWLGNDKALSKLLEAGYSPNIIDENGR